MHLFPATATQCNVIALLGYVNSEALVFADTSMSETDSDNFVSDTSTAFCTSSEKERMSTVSIRKGHRSFELDVDSYRICCIFL